MIRKMELNDIFFVSKIEKEVFGNTLGEKFLFDELTINPFSHYFVLEENKIIIGYIGYRVYDENAEVLNFLIDSEYQGVGNGQSLFDYTLDYIINLGVKVVSLEVRKSNTKAKRFYLKNGFIKSHIRKNYYENEDALVYIKEVE